MSKRKEPVVIDPERLRCPSCARRLMPTSSGAVCDNNACNYKRVRPLSTAERSALGAEWLPHANYDPVTRCFRIVGDSGRWLTLPQIRGRDDVLVDRDYHEERCRIEFGKAATLFRIRYRDDEAQRAAEYQLQGGGR